MCLDFCLVQDDEFVRPSVRFLVSTRFFVGNTSCAGGLIGNAAIDDSAVIFIQSGLYAH